MKWQCGDILLAEFPYTAQAGSKIRPVLIVSADEFNRGRDLTFVPISSAPAPDDPYAFLIQDTDPIFAATGLLRTSSVKWTKPITIDGSIVQRRLGKLASAPLAEIRTRIQQIFA